MARASKIPVTAIINKEPPKTLPPTTTAQDDLVTHGQRKINMIWEFTQATIAVMITGAVVYNAITKTEITKDLSNAFFLIVSMYFVRTNHQLIGGVGQKKGTR